MARKNRSKKSTVRNTSTLIFHPVFLVLFGLLILALCISFFLVLSHPDAGRSMSGNYEESPDSKSNNNQEEQQQQQQQQQQERAVQESQDAAAKVVSNTPFLPYLPVFAEIPNSEQLIEDTLEHDKPSIAGIVAILNRYISKLHDMNLKNADEKAEVPQLIGSYFALTKEHLGPLEDAYRGRSIFPVRDDDSIYVSLAAFREHLLAQTLESAFDQAEHPEQLYVGAVVQNCFGLNGEQCRTGLQVIGKNAEGRDQVKMSDAPPDENGIEVFCTKPKYKSYCDNGQVRALYIHDTDALGPATARYYASKLWGGETYFMQMDAHLEFASHWDSRYIAEVQAAQNYPKAVLSAYPPGFTDFGQYKGGTPGSRLCHCEFSENSVEAHIIRINTGGRTPPSAPKPTQIAFIAAGFFFARANFLTDVPFDPYVPWCFMGEEIALSIRAWTSGWNIYAPRQNLIAHQYRPGRLGLPKFWESVGRESNRPNLNTRLQKHVLRRIKNMVGYPEETKEAIELEGDGVVMTDYEHYALGTERTREAYLELTNIDVANQKCHTMQWCSHGELE